MPVFYGNKKLIPAPLVAIQKEYNTTEDGTIIGSTFVLNVKGKIVPYKGSPTSSGTFWTGSDYPPDEVITSEQTLKSIIRKQEAIRKLFAIEGQSFEVQGWDGSAPLKCNPRIKKIDFPEGQWVNTCEYSIVLEADIVYMQGTSFGEDTGDVVNYKIAKANEEWNIEISDEKNFVYRLTHNISAIGKRFYNEAGSLVKEAWENAQDYVYTRIIPGIVGATQFSASGILTGGTQAYNHMRSNQTDVLGGKFQIGETWLMYDAGVEPPAIEEFTVDTKVGEDGKSHVSIQGNIQGLDVKNDAMQIVYSKFDNASGKFFAYVQPNLFSRAQTISATTLHLSPLNSQYSINKNHGLINYNYEYDNRADFATVGARSEIISLNDHNPTDVFAKIPVLGRTLGPVLQDIVAKTERRRSINIEIQMPAKTQIFTPTKPNTSSLVVNNMPTASVIFTDADEESWSEYTGKYSRNVGFTWEL